MKIPVLGMDPSLRHWGLSEAELDLTDGVLTTPLGSIVEPRDLEGKNIRVNMNDQWLAEQLAIEVTGISSVGVKSVDIRRNTNGVGR